jgi:nitrite reductase/ring-hydroxylating ferredoxin subunit
LNPQKKYILKINPIVALVFVACMLFTDCRRPDYGLFPNVFVDEYIIINNPAYFNLTVIGGWIYHDAGFRGLIVYRRFFNNDVNDFIAYDRGCPIHYDENCGFLDVENDDFTVTCRCGQHTYNIFDGSPIDGTDSPPLFFYRTNFVNGRIHIRN